MQASICRSNQYKAKSTVALVQIRTNECVYVDSVHCTLYSQNVFSQFRTVLMCLVSVSHDSMCVGERVQCCILKAAKELIFQRTH